MNGKDDLVSNIRPKPQGPPPIFKKNHNSLKWSIAIIIGVIIIFIGSIVVTTATWTPKPTYSGQNSKEYKDTLQEWKNSTESGKLSGRIIIEVGALSMIIGGLGGFADTSIESTDKRVFVALAVVGILILVVASVGIIQMSPYSP